MGTWYENKGCHIQDAKANRMGGPGSAMSGPVDCKAGNFCFRNGLKYEPLDMHFQKRSETINAPDCQMRCANTAGCTSFAWYPDGGCHIQDGSARRVQAPDSIVSGGPDCDPTTTSTFTTTKTTTSTKTSTTATTTSSETTTETKTA